MTKKHFCKDCKHTRGIGYDFWCGEGHTEYEVFGAETNCPYYEYHDWSKGTPSRTEKRFIAHIDSLYPVRITGITDKITNKELTVFDEVIDLLNALNDENEQLKQAYTQLKHRHSLLHDVCIDAECDRDSYRNDIASLEKENEQLKKQIEELKSDLKFVRMDSAINRMAQRPMKW